MHHLTDGSPRSDQSLQKQLVSLLNVWTLALITRTTTTAIDTTTCDQHATCQARRQALCFHYPLTLTQQLCELSHISLILQMRFIKVSILPKVMENNDLAFKPRTIQLQSLRYYPIMTSTGRQKEPCSCVHYQETNNKKKAFSKGMGKGCISFYSWKNKGEELAVCSWALLSCKDWLSTAGGFAVLERGSDHFL